MDVLPGASQYKRLTCCAADPHDDPDHNDEDWCDCYHCVAEREGEKENEEEEDYGEEDDEDDEPCYHCRRGPGF